MKKLKIFIKFLVYVLLVSTMLACSNGGHVIDNSTSVLSLSVSAPSQYPAGITTTVPILAYNYGTSTLNNLTYQIINNTTGVDLVITPSSLANCASIAAGADCQLNVTVPANSKAGSFGILAVISSSSLSSSQKSVLNDSKQLQVNVNIGLTDLPPSTGSGVNGISLLYPPTITLPNNAAGTVIITMVVTSVNLGAFNTFNVVDSNGTPLHSQVIGGNSGDNTTNYTVGSVVSLAVDVPSGAGQISFYPQLSEVMSGATSSVSTDNNLSVVTVIRPTSPPQAIISVTPNYINLTTSNPTQVVTVFNSGNAVATGLNNTASAPLSISANTCGTSLAIGDSCTYTITFPSDQRIAGTAVATSNYNGGSQTATVQYTGPDPIAGLSITSTNSDLDFTTTTNNPVESSLVTISNTGQADETLSAVKLPTNFSLGSGSTCSVGTLLQPNTSCSIALVYSNAIITSLTTDIVQVDYTYQGTTGTSLTASSTVGLTYQTIQSQASVSTDFATYNFGNIYDNNYESTTQVITFTNTGDNEATGVSVAISPANSYTQTNNCTPTLAAGASCDVTVTFGPSATAATNESSQLNLTYTTYTGGTTATHSNTLVGNVITATSANISTAFTSSTGFVNNEVGNALPMGGAITLLVQQSTTPNPTATYTITNSSATAAANGFYLNIPSNATLAPWSLSTTGTTCGTYQYTTGSSGAGTHVTAANNLAVSGTCTVTFSLNTSTLGTANLDPSTITMQWSDPTNPTGIPTAQSFAQSPLLANIFAAPTITISESQNRVGIAPSESATFTATLDGGYNVTDQTITVTDPSSATDNITITSIPSPCTLNSATSSCTFTMQTESNTQVGSYPFAIANSGSIVPNASSFTLNVSPAAGTVFCNDLSVGSTFTLNSESYLVVESGTAEPNGIGNATNFANLTAGTIRFCTSHVTNMGSLFLSKTTFNQPIGNWDTSKVISMSHMFEFNTTFNQDISKWSTSNVTDMSYMFGYAMAFNQNLSTWYVKQIASKPSAFDTHAISWSNQSWQPKWGQLPN